MTSAKQVMYLPESICLFISRITQTNHLFINFYAQTLGKKVLYSNCDGRIVSGGKKRFKNTANMAPNRNYWEEKCGADGEYFWKHC